MGVGREGKHEMNSKLPTWEAPRGIPGCTSGIDVELWHQEIARNLERHSETTRHCDLGQSIL